VPTGRAAAGFRELDEQGHADVWQPDATVCGGLLEGRAIADLAAQIGRPVSPHSATSPVGIAANLHLAAIAPTLGHLEFASGAVRRLAPFFPGAATAADITGGALAVPSGPGLGVRPDEEALLAEFPLQPKPPVHARPALYLGSI
jgi:L-alanine-DL-glutamate epimerase-like enolase superfamily enzyme